MAIQIGQSQVVTLVSDSSTPAPLTAYAGIRLIWPQGLQLPAVGIPDALIVQGITLPGYLRTGSGGGLEWVMTAGADPILAALNAIPGPDGWASDAARSLYQNVGATLLARGITLSEAGSVLSQLYQGAVSNHVAAHP